MFLTFSQRIVKIFDWIWAIQRLLILPDSKQQDKWGWMWRRRSIIVFFNVRGIVQQEFIFFVRHALLFLSLRTSVRRCAEKIPDDKWLVPSPRQCHRIQRLTSAPLYSLSEIVYHFPPSILARFSPVRLFPVPENKEKSKTKTFC